MPQTELGSFLLFTQEQSKGKLCKSNSNYMCNSVVVQLQSSCFIHKLILQIMNKQENLSSKSSFDSLPQNSVTKIKTFYA